MNYRSILASFMSFFVFTILSMEKSDDHSSQLVVSRSNTTMKSQVESILQDSRLSPLKYRVELGAYIEGTTDAFSIPEGDSTGGDDWICGVRAISGCDNWYLKFRGKSWDAWREDTKAVDSYFKNVRDADISIARHACVTGLVRKYFRLDVPDGYVVDKDLDLIRNLLVLGYHGIISFNKTHETEYSKPNTTINICGYYPTYLATPITSFSSLHYFLEHCTYIQCNPPQVSDFQGITTLRRLAISSALSVLSNLQKLVIKNAAVIESGALELPHLTALEIRECKKNHAFLNQLSCCTGLTELRLPENNLENIPDAMFHTLTNLQMLDLSNNKFNELPQLITKLIRLRGLNLTSNELLDLQVTNSLTNLRKLNLNLAGGQYQPLITKEVLNLSSLAVLILGAIDKYWKLPIQMTGLTDLTDVQCSLSRVPYMREPSSFEGSIKQLYLQEPELFTKD